MGVLALAGLSWAALPDPIPGAKPGTPGQTAGKEIHIGVLALRGREHAIRRWQPTIDYLSEKLDGRRVSLVPLDFNQVEPAVRDRQVDFMLANSAYYVLLEHKYGVSRIATLRNRSSRGAQTQFSSAMLRLVARTGLRTFADLKHSRIAAVDERSLGGFKMIAGAMLEQGVDVYEDVADLAWLHTHDAVVYAVLAGEADAGIVRSDTLERMAQEGRIQLSDIGLVSPVAGGRFPFLRSTRLYPEWPMAALPHVDTGTNDQLALLLLQMPSHHPAAIKGNHLGWAIPHNYQAVHGLLKRLQQPPYDQPLTLRQVLHDQRHLFAAAVIIVLMALTYALLLGHKNRRLKAAHQALLESEDSEKQILQKLSGAVADLSSFEHRFYKMAETSSEGIMQLDARGAVIFVNGAAARILGYQRSELIGVMLHDLTVPEDQQAQANQGFRHFQETGEGPIIDQRIEVTARHKSGRPVSLELAVSTLEEGDNRSAIGIFRDITERQQMLRALKESQENFHNIVRKNRTGILLLDLEGEVIFTNPAAARMLRREVETMPGMKFGVPASLDVRTETSVVRADGELGVAETLFTLTEWNNLPAYLVMLHDVTPYRDAQEKINELAFTDSLTHLANRSHLMLQLEDAVLRHKRNHGQFALLFLDLDKFKDVNDTLGHQIGDHLLVEVSQRLQASVRSSDLVARMGGDEFTILLDDVRDDETIEGVACKIAERIRQPYQIAGHELFISTSIGCSRFPESSETAQELLKQADTAMYRAKREGTGYASYSTTMGDMVARSAKIEQELHRAIKHQEFEMYYQVQVDLETSEPAAYEALVRWNHPQNQVVGPGEFIPVLESTGMIVELGRWILDQVCRKLRERLDHESESALPVAVNLSPIQLERDQLAPFISELLKRYRLPPRLLVVEITESAMLTSSEHAIPQLHALREQGVEMHLDDFGTGYSALSMLKRLPFSVIKIDRAFIRDLETDGADLGLTRAAIAMAQGLGMKALAEGIETPQQQAILRKLGCDYGQGYLFGRPAPFDQPQARESV